MKVSDCLREFQTGGLRRQANGKPFEDVIPSERTPRRERDVAPHPSLKPQSFMRQIVYAALPLGTGVIIDPFMGSGSTIAAAEAVGVRAIGAERYRDYFEMACESISKLTTLKTPAIDLNFGVQQPKLFKTSSLKSVNVSVNGQEEKLHADENYIPSRSL
jgi:site-specific DNA-methyltransferase (adenine-specific)